jgi:hypothetical protein
VAESVKEKVTAAASAAAGKIHHANGSGPAADQSPSQP